MNKPIEYQQKSALRRVSRPLAVLFILKEAISFLSSCKLGLMKDIL
jgi:hypothetical protein